MKRFLVFALMGLALVLGGCSEDTPMQPAESEALPTITMAEFAQLLETGRGESSKAHVLPSTLHVIGEGSIAYNRALSGPYMNETVFLEHAGDVFFYQLWWQQDMLGDLRTHIFSDRLDDAPATWSEVPVEPQEILDTVQRVVSALSNPSERILASYAFFDEAIIYLYYFKYLDDDGIAREFVMSQMRLREL